jgi:Linalool dehydratase/isomerase
MRSASEPLAFPPRRLPWGPLTLRRLGRTLALYAGVLLMNWSLIQSTSRSELQALALGLMVPGGGFLAWADPGNPQALWAIGLAAGSVVAFVTALALWFATGNVLLPVAAWFGTALAAATAKPLLVNQPDVDAWPVAITGVPLGLVLLLVSASGTAMAAQYRNLRIRKRLGERLAQAAPATVASACDEIDSRQLQQMRLLLDRALQPVDRFDGFEWIDQFQTAAVRYQINFVSYALAMAGHVHLPAFAGYLLTAQRNLAEKLLDHRIWRYWQRENLWGNLSADPDPIPRDNIMLSGFLAAQLGYARAASGLRDFDAPGSLVFAHPSGTRYDYSLPSIVDALVRQYERAPYGLLACEPNWIYPLCNAITATAIRCSDAQQGTGHWHRLEPAFRRHLESEFITAAGRLVPFRSGLTGLAAPQIGGALMQAFPCLFLNAVLPDIARRQWILIRDDLTPGRAQRALWPIDIGNYRISRASSYAAAAAAAVEMGDGEIAAPLLEALDRACPLEVVGGGAHRARASLWAHAAEMIARFGHADALRSLVTAPPHASCEGPRAGPFIKAADYPDVLVAKAVNRDGALSAVLYPGTKAGFLFLTFGGLAPSETYVAAIGRDYRFVADAHGEARLSLPIFGRTELRMNRCD